MRSALCGRTRRPDEAARRSLDGAIACVVATPRRQLVARFTPQGESPRRSAYNPFALPTNIESMLLLSRESVRTWIPAELTDLRRRRHRSGDRFQ